MHKKDGEDNSPKFRLINLQSRIYAELSPNIQTVSPRIDLQTVLANLRKSVGHVLFSGASNGTWIFDPGC